MMGAAPVAQAVGDVERAAWFICGA